jgi:hypothetical protein
MGKLLSENQKGHRRTDGDAKLVDEGKEPV